MDFSPALNRADARHLRACQLSKIANVRLDVRVLARQVKGMPTDHFTVLGVPRRPWLDPELLKERFHQLTASGHPDVGGDPQAFAAVNAAYATLREPAPRLKHFLELEAPDALCSAGAQIPEALAESFMRAATLRRAVDAFVKQMSAATTPVARALLASDQFAIRRDVEHTLEELDGMRARCVQAIQHEDEKWTAGDCAGIARLAGLQQELAYLEKWAAQVREALLSIEG